MAEMRTPKKMLHTKNGRETAKRTTQNQIDRSNQRGHETEKGKWEGIQESKIWENKDFSKITLETTQELTRRKPLINNIHSYSISQISNHNFAN
jgi:hypothetical protein